MHYELIYNYWWVNFFLQAKGFHGGQISPTKSFQGYSLRPDQSYLLVSCWIQEEEGTLKLLRVPLKTVLGAFCQLTPA